MKKILNVLIGTFIIVAFVLSTGIAEFQAIEKGSKGSRVTIIQEWLNKLGYDCGTADGSFGGKTEAAVKKFQEANGLDITGVVGEKTYNALLNQAGAFESENDNDNNDIGSENNNNETEQPDAPPKIELIDGKTTLRELFPDKEFAKLIRDKLGKKSIDQTITQAELDGINSIYINTEIHSLTSISYLRNLTYFRIDRMSSMVMHDQHFGPDGLYYKGMSIPAEFGELVNLEEFVLEGGDDNYFEFSFAKMTHLKTFKAEFTYLTKLPDSLKNCTELQELDVTGSEIASLPEWIGNFKNIKTLKIWYAKFTSLPNEIGELTSLTDFEAFDSSINTLPDSFYKLTSLVTLDLRKSDITAISPFIKNMVSLSTIKLAETKISELPDELFLLPSLTSLDISDTPISSLPDFVYDMDYLSIDMSGTKIE